MSAKKLNIAIAGATGFVGLDLIKFLSKHPMVKINIYVPKKILIKKFRILIKNFKKITQDKI